LGSVSSLVLEKKIFEISANESILLALAAMLNIRLERKTETLQRTTQGPFLLSLVPIGPLVSEKKLEIRKVYRRRTPSDGFGPGELKITVKTSSIPFLSSVLDLIKIDKYIILPLNDCDWQECYFDLS
jgi:hypothetical protein